MDKKKIKVSIIIVSYNTRDLLEKCLESIRRFTKNVDYEVIVVDNASHDGSVKFLSEYGKISNIKIIKNKNTVGFAKANNIGIKKATGKYLVLQNSDTEIRDDLIGNIYHWMEKNPKVGISTCKLVYPNGGVQSAGGYFPSLMRVASWMIFQDLPYVDNIIKPFQPHKEMSLSKNDDIYDKNTKFDWLAGTFFVIRREVLKGVGLLDEDYFMYTEDVDYCYRAKKSGWEIGYLPQYSIIHHKGASGTNEFAVTQEFAGIKLFYKKHFAHWKYPLLILLLKLGAFLRFIGFKIIGNSKHSKIYAKTIKNI